MVKISRQGQIYNVLPKKVVASLNWYDMKTFEFNLIFAAHTATNFKNMYLCIPLKIKKTDNDDNTDATLITVNNFFMHFIKEIDILRYEDD